MKRIFTLFFVSAMTVLNLNARNNPLIQPFNTPHHTAPFPVIENSHFLPAFLEAMETGRSEISAIVGNPEAPTFENTIEALERSGRMLSRISGVFSNLRSAETNEELQQIAREVSPLLTQYQNDISLNPELFARVRVVYEKRETLSLNPEQKMLLDNTYNQFVRRGANLSDGEKERFREISTELSLLSLKFGENVLRETNRFEKHITDEFLVAGLPGSLLEAASIKARSKGLDGWLFDITMPMYGPFMRYADNRELRRELFMANSSKGLKGDELDNQENVKRIVSLRLEMARLLGYNTYADYVLERSMASGIGGVYKLLDQLLEAATPVAMQEKLEVEAFARSMGFNETLMPWDWSYYAEKLKEQKYSLNDEMLKPYFELNRTIDGVFGLATDLFGITFRLNRDIPVYHEEVLPYEVYDEDGTFLSVLYADFHPRPGKQGGAWMSSFKSQWIESGVDSRPHVTIVMNFTRPTDTKPSLLTFYEFRTFLHEFGHALHGMLSRTTYSNLSGTSVYRDFVELPSQIMENWSVEKEFLDKFAVHYETGEKIPENLVQRIKDSENFNTGYATLRQLSFGYVDMAWHTLSEPYAGEVKLFEEEAWKKTQLFPAVEGTAMSTQFSHLFAGGYAAGYYSYKWSEVLDADAFSLFRKNGLFDKATARSFRENILEKGGTEHPLELYKRYRGQEPAVDALLERSGLK
jgi:peptidyl-dipeptidase Dcp